MLPSHSGAPVSTLPRRRSWLWLLTVLGLLLSLAAPPRPSFALTASDLQILMVTDPLLVSDSNGCSGGDGPQAAYVGFKITNISGGALTNLSVNLGDFDPGFALAGGQAATQYVGTLAAGASDIVYWYLSYPCHTAADFSDTLTVTVSDGVSAPYAYSNADAPSITTTENVTTTIQSVSTISANAGGLYQAANLGPGAVIGQIIPYDVTYSFGGVAVGDRYQLQPSGEPSFNAGCFQLVNTAITASNVTAIPVGSTDDLFYYASVSQPGSGHTVTVRYFFVYLCTGINTSALPYASQTSGSTNVKYAESGYTPANAIVFPPATNAFQVSKSASQSYLPSGGPVTYTVLITNTSSFDSSISRVADTLPAGVTYGALLSGPGETSAEVATRSSVQPAAGATGGVQWLGGLPSVFPYDSYRVPANSTLRLVYTASVPAGVGSYTNSAAAYVGSTQIGGGAATVSVGGADVAVTKGGPASVNAGGQVAYTITVTNNGPSTTGATLSDPLPAGVTMGSLTAPAGWTCTTPAVGAAGTISCANPAFAPGSAVFTLVGQVGAGEASGTVIANTATVASTLFDPNPSNQSATATTTVTAPALTATKGATLAIDTAPAGASPGDTLQYEVVVANTGSGPASGVIFSDTPDANTALVVGSVASTAGAVTSGNAPGDSSVGVSVGTLGAAASATITFRVLIDSPIADGVAEVRNQGVVTAPGLPSVLTDDPATAAGGDATITPVTAEPRISAVKTVSRVVDSDEDGITSPGDTLEYEVTVTNSGNQAGLASFVNDVLDPNTELLVGTVTTSQGSVTRGNTPGDTSVRVDFGSIAGAGGSATMRFRAVIDNPLPVGVATVMNQALVSGSNFPTIATDDPSTGAAGDTTAAPVTAAPILMASKVDLLIADADGDSIAEPGDTLLYQVTISNTGNTDAVGVAFSDTPDANTSLVPGTVAASLGTVTSGNSPGDTTVAVAAGDLAAGASVTISYQVTINNPLPAGVALLANQGTVTAGNHPAVSTDDPGSVAGGDPTRTLVEATPLLTADKAVSLFDDADGNSVPSPGDLLLYTITVANLGNVAEPAVTFSDTPDVNTALVVGSVQTNRGSVTSGNSAGESSVGVSIGTLPGGGASATITFQVRVADPLPAGVTFVRNQGVVSSPSAPLLITNDPATGSGGDATDLPITVTPTAITLSRFTFERTSGGVELVWATALELDTWGFHLYRSPTRHRADGVRVTPQLIPAQGGAGGATYRWVDAQAAADTGYTYWLEEIELSGRAQYYGPAAAVARTAGVWKIALPFLVR